MINCIFPPFCSHGRLCARHPVKIILGSLLVSLICSLGLLNFHWEANAIKLWIPTESDFARNYAFLWENYAPDMRFHSLLFATDRGENILEPKYIQKVGASSSDSLINLVLFYILV